ncbi:MAG: phosphate acetyltransferase [Chthoniobacterales bacterium]
MAQHTFLTIPVGSNVGLTSVSIGLVRTMERLGVDVGFFKALGQPRPNEEFDHSSAYLEATTALRPPDPVSHSHVVRAGSTDEIGALMEEVVARFEPLYERHDIVIVEGLVTTQGLPQAAKLNAALARALSSEVVLGARSEVSTADAIVTHLEEILHQLPATLRRNHPGVVLNHVDLDVLVEDLGLVKETHSFEPLYALRKRLGKQRVDCDLIGLAPAFPELSAPRVCDVVDLLGGRLLFPGDMEKRRIKKISLCARSVPNILHVLRSGMLIVTPSDRSDLILAVAHAATRSIQLAGLILTSDMEPDERILNFCRDALEFDGGLPVIRVPDSSYKIARRLQELNNEIPVSDLERIELVMDTVARAIDSQWVRERCEAHVAKRLSPPAFRHRISSIARSNLRSIILPEGDEPRIVQAAIHCAERGIARCILLGKPEQIHEVAQVNDLALPDLVQTLDPEFERGKFLESYMKLRAHKNPTEKDAVEVLRDNTVLATMMLAMGEVDGLVSGAVHSTADTIRPALQLIRTSPEAKVVSSVFFMCLPDQVLVYGDCAVNRDPDAETLADIAIQSARSASAFGIEPVVAMISYSTLGSGAGSDVEKVRKATEIVRQLDPTLVIDGPLQYDAASIAEVAATKAPDSKVAGRANVFIFPDLNTGNTTYKAVQRSANVISMGPMLQGLRKPVNDLSRGASVEDIIYTIALTAIQSQS